MAKLTVAVFFGGRSSEHDVSIVTGQQVLQSLDPDRFTALPVYVALDGSWRSGPELTQRSTFVPTKEKLAALPKANVALGDPVRSKLRLQFGEKKLFGGNARTVEADFVIPAFHGRGGEDGAFQGLMESLEVPYLGAGVLGAAAAMDKVFTKQALGSLGIQQLPCAVLNRPASGFFMASEDIAKAAQAQNLPLAFPICVKPAALGSSIGVHRVDDTESLAAAVSDTFRLTDKVMLEPFLADNTEYNVAVAKLPEGYVASDIERPKHSAALLDFAEKYRSGSGGPKKSGFGGGEGMADLGREIDPAELTDAEKAELRATAVKIAEGLRMAGVNRVDFIRAAGGGPILFNEINTIPGSFAYYLWRGRGLNMTDLLSGLIDEALARYQRLPGEFDVPASAQLFPRK